MHLPIDVHRELCRRTVWHLLWLVAQLDLVSMWSEWGFDDTDVRDMVRRLMRAPAEKP
jgi:hypothetical protein